MLSLKYKKGTDTSLPHTEIYLSKKYLGYFLPNKSIFAAVGENWNFVTSSEQINCFHAKTKKELLETEQSAL
jgi:hypothetical protein